MHLGRIPEAEAALSAALEKYPDDMELIANTIVLNVLAGKPTEELELYVSFFSVSLPEYLMKVETNCFADVFSKFSHRIPFWPILKRKASFSIRRLPSMHHGCLREFCLGNFLLFAFFYRYTTLIAGLLNELIRRRNYP